MSDPETRANAGDEGEASPKRRHKPLDSLERVRRELSRIYFQAKDGTMPMEKAKGLTYLLSQLSAVLKAATSNDSELAALLQQVRERMGAGIRQ